MKRQYHVILSLLAICTSTSFCFGQYRAPGIEKAPLTDLIPITAKENPLIVDTAEQAAAKAIREKLKQPAVIEAIELELASLLKELGRKHEVNIVLDPVGLEAAGVTADQFVTLDLKGISLRSALNILLRPLGLAYEIRDEVLVITSADCPEDRATVQVYALDSIPAASDTRDLLDMVRMAWPPPADPVALDRPRNIPGEPVSTPCKPRAVIVGTRLVVRGSPRHHAEVERLLGELAAAPVAQPAVIDKAPIEAPAAVLPPRRVPPIAPEQER